jgi:putative zinc finger/helix-turn-helix YgiT family protein
MNSVIVPFPAAEVRDCDDCSASGSVRLTYKDQEFAYGEKDQVILRARVPVWKCSECGAQYTDGSAEEIRHDAVCRHLERLTPAEVLQIRKQYGLSQAEWAELTGFGVASVKRWENGSWIQNEAADRLLRLLRERSNFVLLMGIAAPPKSATQFRTEFSAEVRTRSQLFVLNR